MTDTSPPPPDDASEAAEATRKGRAAIRLAYDQSKVVGELVGGELAAPPTSGKGRPKAAAEPITRNSWVDHFQRDNKRVPIPNLANVLVALRMAPELAEIFAYNEMRYSVVLKSPIPRVFPAEEGREPAFLSRDLQDFDAGRVQEWLQREIPTIGLTTVFQAIDLRARERSFHPIREYLDSLIWDKQPRLEKWLAYYLGAEPSEYHGAIGRFFLVSMVARIYKPGCKVDYMPILEGPQGVKKSSFGPALVGQKYFTDNIPDITKADASQHLRGIWLGEFGELAGFRRSDINAIKTFLTRQVEKYRPPYGHAKVEEPRQGVFFGTVNLGQYFKDETGNRRFWPVQIGSIDLDALTADRDQLFAEARRLYQNNARWWPDAHESPHFDGLTFA